MSKFTISFDYELAWGLYGRKDYGYIESHVIHSNLVAKQILEINKEYSMPATWAIVGIATEKNSNDTSFFFDHIFNNANLENKETFKNLISNDKLSQYGDVINIIIKNKEQELASHTYFHIFFDDFDTNSDVVEADFEKFSLLSQRLKKEIVSIIMPKNIYKTRYSKRLKDNGIKCVRINPDNFLYSGLAYKKPNQIIRFLRALDYYLPINEIIDLFTQNRTPKKQETDILHFTEATLFLRGSSKHEVINWISYYRFIIAVRYRIFRKKDIHIWTHPHNFGENIQQSLRWYKKIIAYTKNLEEKGILVTKNMKNLVPLQNNHD